MAAARVVLAATGGVCAAGAIMDKQWQPLASLNTLQRRAQLRDQVRAHLRASGALEVDVPVVQAGPNRDHEIQPAALVKPPGRWLTTSPEHTLKRLVSAGYGAVWCFQPCLRLGESGRLHRPEFTMLEWYRPGWSLARLITETVELLAQLIGCAPAYERLTWRAVMAQAIGCDPEHASREQLQACCDQHQAHWSRHDLLDLIFATQVQPHLGFAGISVVEDWPPAAAAQARVYCDQHGQEVAARFEVFINGVELANGYDECVDAGELRRRFDQHAQATGAPPQHDEAYLAALAHGLPACSGVAVGFDRVVLLATGLQDIGETMAFPWERA